VLFTDTYNPSTDDLFNRTISAAALHVPTPQPTSFPTKAPTPAPTSAPIISDEELIANANSGGNGDLGGGNDDFGGDDDYVFDPNDFDDDYVFDENGDVGIDGLRAQFEFAQQLQAP
jgi:hypothetical protein